MSDSNSEMSESSIGDSVTKANAQESIETSTTFPNLWFFEDTESTSFTRKGSKPPKRFDYCQQLESTWAILVLGLVLKAKRCGELEHSAASSVDCTATFRQALSIGADELTERLCG